MFIWNAVSFWYYDSREHIISSDEWQRTDLSFNFSATSQQIVLARANFGGFILNIGEPIVDRNFFSPVLVAVSSCFAFYIWESLFVEEVSKSRGCYNILGEHSIAVEFLEVAKSFQCRVFFFFEIFERFVDFIAFFLERINLRGGFFVSLFFICKSGTRIQFVPLAKDFFSIVAILRGKEEKCSNVITVAVKAVPLIFAFTIFKAVIGTAPLFPIATVHSNIFQSHTDSKPVIVR